MKIRKKANGAESIEMNREEWEKIGKIAGWDLDEIDPVEDDPLVPEIYDDDPFEDEEYDDEDDPLVDRKKGKLGLDKDVEEMLQELEVEVDEESKEAKEAFEALPPEVQKAIKREKGKGYIPKTDEEKAEAAAIAEEEEKRLRDISKQRRKEDFLKKEVWEKEPIYEDIKDEITEAKEEIARLKNTKVERGLSPEEAQKLQALQVKIVDLKQKLKGLK